MAAKFGALDWITKVQTFRQEAGRVRAVSVTFSELNGRIWAISLTDLVMNLSDRTASLRVASRPALSKPGAGRHMDTVASALACYQSHEMKVRVAHDGPILSPFTGANMFAAGSLSTWSAQQDND